MYVILVYDIKMEDKGERVLSKVFKICKTINKSLLIFAVGVLSKVFKICKKYLTHIQNSVFEGELTASQLYALQCELNQHIRKDRDSVVVFKSRNSAWLEKEFFGKVDNKTSFFL